MSAITDLFHSEKGLWAFLVPMLGATGMLISGTVDAQQWMDFAKVMAGIYVSGKTVQGVGQAVVKSRETATAAREGLAELEERLKKNDALVDGLIAELKDGDKTRYAATPEG